MSHACRTAKLRKPMRRKRVFWENPVRFIGIFVELFNKIDDCFRQGQESVHVVLHVGDVQCSLLKIEVVVMQGKDFASPAACPPSQQQEQVLSRCVARFQEGAEFILGNHEVRFCITLDPSCVGKRDGILKQVSRALLTTPIEKCRQVSQFFSQGYIRYRSFSDDFSASCILPFALMKVAALSFVDIAIHQIRGDLLRLEAIRPILPLPTTHSQESRKNPRDFVQMTCRGAAWFRFCVLQNQVANVAVLDRLNPGIDFNFPPGLERLGLGFPLCPRGFINQRSIKPIANVPVAVRPLEL